MPVMVNSMSASEPGKLQSWIKKRRWWLAGLATVLVFVFILAITPVVISSQFQKWVLANGGERVSVENVDFNPFTARLLLENIIIERTGYQPFVLPRLDLQTQWLDLLSRRFVIRNMTVHGVQLTIDERNPEQRHIGGILISQLQGKKQETVEDETKPWFFRLEALSLEKTSVVFWHEKLHSTLAIASMSLTGLDTTPGATPALLAFDGSLDNAAVKINGMVNPLSSTSLFNGNLQVQQLATGSYLAFLSDSLQQNQAVISINSKLEVKRNEGNAYDLQQDGELMLDQLIWQQQATGLKAGKLSWRGTLGASVSLDTKSVIGAKGKLSAEDVQFSDRSSNLLVGNQKTVWQGKTDVQYSKQQGLAVELDGQLSNQQLDLKTDQPMKLKNASLSWQGQMRTSLGGNGALQVDASGELQNTGFAFDEQGRGLQFLNDAIAWKGDFSYANANSEQLLKSSSDLILSGLEINTLNEPQRLLLIREMRVEKAVIESIEALNLDKLVFAGFSLGNVGEVPELSVNADGFVNYKQLIVEQLDYSASQGLHIHKVIQNGLQHVVVRSASGQWDFDSFITAIDKLVTAEPPGETGATVEKKPQDPNSLPIKIDAVVAENGGELFYVDRRLPQPLVQQIKLDAFELLNVDSQKPTEGSELTFKAKLDNTAVTINGTVTVFAAGPTFDLTGDVKALSLLPFSTLMEKSLGYQVDSGSLNAHSVLQAEDGSLNSTTDLTLFQLDVEPLSAEALEKLDAKLNAGLESGLSLLKDKNDTIKLSIPVKGALNDLKVDPGDIINQALGSALKKGAKTYFAAALFPFGTLLVIADAASGKAMQVSLDPVFFDPGLNVIAVKDHAYLEKVAMVLDDKPEINVKICGVSTASDRWYFIEQMKNAAQQKQQLANAEKPAVNDAGKVADKQPLTKDTTASVIDEQHVTQLLAELAIQRAEAVSAFLIHSQGVAVQRLVSCKPRLEMEGEKKARTDLIL